MKAALAACIAAGAAVGFLIPAEKGGSPASAAPAAQAVTGAAGETRLMRAQSGHFHTSALVNGEPVEFIVDTGATTVALTVEDARRIGIKFDPSEFEVVGTGASGPVRGQAVTIERVSIDGKEVRTLRGAVLEGLGISLLGQAYLSRIGSVEMKGDEMVLR
jgi:aspartyl protease family protein